MHRPRYRTTRMAVMSDGRVRAAEQPFGPPVILLITTQQESMSLVKSACTACNVNPIPKGQYTTVVISIASLSIKPYI